VEFHFFKKVTFCHQAETLKNKEFLASSNFQNSSLTMIESSGLLQFTRLKP